MKEKKVEKEEIVIQIKMNPEEIKEIDAAMKISGDKTRAGWARRKLLWSARNPKFEA